MGSFEEIIYVEFEVLTKMCQRDDVAEVGQRIKLTKWYSRVHSVIWSCDYKIIKAKR